MVGRKPIRTRGKISMKRYFQDIKEGEYVAVDRELSRKRNFPKRLQGKTGVVIGKRGRSYIIAINDIEKEKIFIIEPIHLKKIKPVK